MKVQAKRQTRRPSRPVTLAEVDEFLLSPVARHYYTFSDSNVKRRLVRMMFFLRAQVDQLQRQLSADAEPERLWTQRLSKR